MVERERTVVVVDRHECLLEASFRDGHLGARLAVDGELVALLAGETFYRGDEIGRHPLRDHVVLVTQVVVVGGESVGVHGRRS